MAAVVGDESLAPRPSGAERAGEAEQTWPGTIQAGPRHWVWHAGADIVGTGAGVGAGAGLGVGVGGDAGVGGEEARRLGWLADRMPCPLVLWSGGRWLLTTAPAGHPADEPERQPRPDDVPGLIGTALRQLHELPVADCPFERPWQGEVDLLTAAVEAGRLDRSRLPAPYDRYEPQRLVALLGSATDDQDGPVVCHGNPVVANWWFDQGSLTATVGVHRLGLADRHLDLAVVYRSLQLHFGPESVYGFIEGYGLDPDLVRLDRHVMLDVLRAAAAHPLTAGR